MRKQFYKIKQFNECISLDFHWSMLAVKHNAMLIVIHIRRILESPRSIIDCDRNNSVVLPCRMINTSRISFIFRAKKTFRITSGFYIPCRGNCFGSFSGLDKLMVISISPYGLSTFHFLILLYTIPADIIAVLTQLIKIISSFLRAFCIFVPEFFLYLTRTWHQTVHQSGIK